MEYHKKPDREPDVIINDYINGHDKCEIWLDEQIETYTSILTSKGKPYDIENQNPIAKWNFNEDGDIYYTTYLGGEEHLYKESCLDSYFEKAIKDLQLEKQLYKENFGTMHVTVRRNLDSFEDTLTYERC